MIVQHIVHGQCYGLRSMGNGLIVQKEVHIKKPKILLFFVLSNKFDLVIV